MENSITDKILTSPLKQDIKFLKGVGPKRAEIYAKLGIKTCEDLLNHYPRKYIDCTSPQQISNAPLFEFCCVKATVYNKTPGKVIRKNMIVYKVLVSDSNTNMSITIFNNKFLYNNLEVGKDYIFYGQISGNFIKKEMTSPTVISLKNAKFMKPIYPLTKGITSAIIETNVKNALSLCLNDIEEIYPQEILDKYELIPLKEAIMNIHFPKNDEDMKKARYRLAFDELLIMTLALSQLGKNKKKDNFCAFGLSSDNEKIKAQLDEFFNTLPFSLTQDQLNAIYDCVKDMQLQLTDNISANTLKPMARLIQGDVGSGKTMVAAAVIYLIAKKGYQASLMAPTEILAKQHYHTIMPLFEKIGVKTAFLCGSTTKKQKDEIKKLLSLGEIQLLIGTHAVITEDVVFKNLALVITDEQHRFGVKQRQAIATKGDNPHVMAMSATPIPRSLALVVYGDLDISLIKTMPRGRKQIQTFLIDTPKRERMYGFIKKQLQNGYQGYIVCPAVEENEDTNMPLEIENVVNYHEKIKKYFNGYTTAILHGKMKAKEKDEIMQSFAKNEINLLVCTTVIEVGVDVPNANIIAIENAERFGLSQLHQLRGRVGRGSVESFCILISDEKNENSKVRLKTLAKVSDGFALAEEDLKLRGPGDFFGEAQHGLPKLKIADLANTDENDFLLSSVLSCAKYLINRKDFLTSCQYAKLNYQFSNFLVKIGYGSIS